MPRENKPLQPQKLALCHTTAPTGWEGCEYSTQWLGRQLCAHTRSEETGQVIERCSM